MLKINKSMQKHIAQSNIINFEELSRLFSLEIIEYCDCVVLSGGIENCTFKSVDDIKKVHYDSTSFEACINEIYVNHHYFEAYRETPQSFKTIMEISFAMVTILSERLKGRFPEKAFQITLSFDINSDDSIDDSATVRFTTIRKDEKPYINASAIDSIAQPVLIFETE